MAVRTTMSDLITRVRTLINDPSGSSQTFDDQFVQDTLDRYQTKAYYAELRPTPVLLPSGIYDKASFGDYYAGVGNWEADETLYNLAFDEAVPTTADRLTGHWTFLDGQLPPVKIIGKFYDIYGAAADLLEDWAARAALEFDFTTDGQTFHRSQKMSALQALAQRYRAQQRPRTARQERDDVLPDWKVPGPLGANWRDF